MTEESKKYDCMVVGGGIAGLCLSIQLARLGYSVAVFEKHKYPFHKVCGEYVSNECYGFLTRLGMQLSESDLPQINQLCVSSEKGYLLTARLDLGGFGISRHRLDFELMKLAAAAGVKIFDGTKVTAVNPERVVTSSGGFAARIIVGAFGKANPAFASENISSASDYVGVKYHVLSERPGNRIELHNFSGGYCGISRIEDGKYCLCYVSRAGLLKKSEGVRQMEARYLFRNPHIRNIFESSEFVSREPLTISNIRFSARQTHNKNMLFIGDAAGCISPLTGNGMSMSAYTSMLLAELIHLHLGGALARSELAAQYSAAWRRQFIKRIERGRQLQALSGNRHLSDIALRVINPFERMKRAIIRSTHGVPF